jgi:gliding motility-associated-like protein
MNIKEHVNLKVKQMNYLSVRNKFMKSNQLKGLLLCFLILGMVQKFTYAQLTVIGNQTATDLAQMMAGPGVTVANATFNNCEGIANGKFWVTPPNVSNLGIDSGIVLTSGTAQTGFTGTGVNAPAGVNTTAHVSDFSDPDLVTISGFPSRDACVLEFDFVPLGDTVKFEYVFGSCEYPSFTCSSFNDAFGFFIDGPGITGPFSNNSANIAIVPTTSACPVGVNTINLPTPGGNCCNTTQICYNSTAPCATLTAAQMATLFVCNGNGTTVMYPGFTAVLTAQALTIPCSTYHLKLAISDASDQSLDSGVFLKAGSLSSNAITFTPISNLINPYPYIVEGCAAGFIKVKRPVASSAPYTINYQVGGSASYPADYNVSTIPPGAPFGQVTIPANDTVAYIVIGGIQDNTAEPIEEIKIYQLAPCSNSIVDSVSLFISDTIQMYIMTPDTAICKEDSVFIQVSGDDSLIYSWTPTTNINNPNIKNPTVSPNVTTDYIVCATLPNSGCAAKCDTIRITINQEPSVNIGNDTIICLQQAIQFNPAISPNQNYSYTWSGPGSGFLNATNIPNPLGTFTQLGNWTLYLQVEPTAVGCAGYDTMNVFILPNDITLHNGDTTVCRGATIPINVTGHPLFSYTWSPTAYLNNPSIEDPISIPDANVSYTVTATYPGCIPMSKSFDINVEPVPVIDAGPDRVMCQYDTVQLHATVDQVFAGYTYTWTPGVDLSNASILDPVFDGMNNTNLQLIVSTPIGCADTDFVFITVHSVEFANASPEEETICPRDSVQLQANGGVAYHWEPALYLNDQDIPNPVSKPKEYIEYTLYSTSQFGCTDTDLVRIMVSSEGVIDAGEDITLYPGESANINPDGNCSFYNWTPNYHLSSDKIKNPIATPPVTTQYFVTGTTEFGCPAIDSITIRISPESILDLPNAFSPGSGTSINDELRIIKRGLATLNFFRIYNRWGELVFETNDIEKGWNGQYKGKPQPMGTYVYVVDAKTTTGKRFNKQGNVTLIR